MMRRCCFPLFLAGLAAVVPFAAQAACLPDSDADEMAQSMLEGRMIETPAVETMDDGYCTQAKVVEWMSVDLGGVAGYKAGLTSAPAQQRFGVDEPISGVLLYDMLLPSGSTVPAAFAARPMMEADLIVTVGDAAINEARTADDVAAALADIRPFIELPDLAVTDPAELKGPQIAAINVGSKLGVVGEPVSIDSFGGKSVLDALAGMTVTLTDQDGVELVSAPGSAILGQPLESVLFLLERGIRFQVGDVISLGSFGPLLPPKPGTTVSATYRGLPGNPSVRVTFQ